jgi:hypothetical protein
VINALGLIGDESAADTLKRRYPTEEEDARFYTLKALDYIGGSSRAFAKEQGAKDASNGCRRLAERIG